MTKNRFAVGKKQPQTKNAARGIWISTFRRLWDVQFLARRNTKNEEGRGRSKRGGRITTAASRTQHRGERATGRQHQMGPYNRERRGRTVNLGATLRLGKSA